jgi:hypothetical protein
MDVEHGARLDDITLDLVAQQCPVSTLEQFEHTRRLAGRTADRRLWRAVTREQATNAFRLLE